MVAALNVFWTCYWGCRKMAPNAWLSIGELHLTGNQDCTDDFLPTEPYLARFDLVDDRRCNPELW